MLKRPSSLILSLLRTSLPSLPSPASSKKRSTRLENLASAYDLQPSSLMANSVKRMAYSFDGQGNFFSKTWDLGTSEERPHGELFSWYHVELPRSHTTLLSAAQYLISTLCPPLKLQDILALASNGPFCGYIDGALIFRANSAGPTTSEYTQKLAGRVTEDSLITVALGRIPRLEFSSVEQRSFLSEIPSLEISNSASDRFVIQQHVLEFYLTRNHLEDVNHRIPKSVLTLVVHIIDTHIDHLQDVLTRLEMDLDENEHELDTGGYLIKQKMLGDRLFPRMQLKLQRLLQAIFRLLMTIDLKRCRLATCSHFFLSFQVVSHGEQVFPRFKEKLTSKNWCSMEELEAIQMLVGRLHKQKENVGFLATRITALQAGLDTWQSEQINRKLYYLSFLSIIFLPLSIVTSAFGMNVGGIPWTEQRNPDMTYGFQNVLFLCVTILLFLLGCFSAPVLYKHVRNVWTSKNKWMATTASFRWRRALRNDQPCNGYIQL